MRSNSQEIVNTDTSVCMKLHNNISEFKLSENKIKDAFKGYKN